MSIRHYDLNRIWSLTHELCRHRSTSNSQNSQLCQNGPGFPLPCISDTRPTRGWADCNRINNRFFLSTACNRSSLKWLNHKPDLDAWETKTNLVLKESSSVTQKQITHCTNANAKPQKIETLHSVRQMAQMLSHSSRKKQNTNNQSMESTSHLQPYDISPLPTEPTEDN